MMAKRGSVPVWMALLGTILAGFVLISVASAGTKVWGILKPSSETENNFYQLAERINTLIEDENDYAINT